MQLILEKNDNSIITVAYCDKQKSQRDDESDNFSWADDDRRASQGYLSPWPMMTEEQARAIFRQGEEAVVFALLQLAKQLAEQQAADTSPSTPSGMKPAYEKPTVS